MDPWLTGVTNGLVSLNDPNWEITIDGSHFGKHKWYSSKQPLAFVICSADIAQYLCIPLPSLFSLTDASFYLQGSLY